MAKDLTPEEKKKLEQAAKKAGYAPGEFLDLIGKGVREIALPIPDSLVYFWKKKKKKK